MARAWTKEEQKRKRKELLFLYKKENKIIGEISKILNISQSSVFDRIKKFNIPTSPKKKVHYLNKNKAKLPKLSNNLAEFFGIMLGDGHINHYKNCGTYQIFIYIYNVSDNDYVPYVKSLLTKLFNLPVGCNYRKIKNGEMANLFVSSVDLINYLKQKGLYSTNKVKDQIDIPKWVLSKKSYQKNFIKGFFDTDGSIYRLKYGVQMSFCNRAKPLLETTRKILINLGFHPSKISNYNIYLTKQNDLKKYIKEIGFGNLKHFNRAKEFGVI